MVSLTPIVNPTLFGLPCNFLGDRRYTMLQILSLTRVIFIQISTIHDNVSSQVTYKRRQGFGQWMNSSIIHANISSRVLYKKCHSSIFHSYIQYHTTLNIIFSVVCPLVRLLDSLGVVLGWWDRGSPCLSGLVGCLWWGPSLFVTLDVVVQCAKELYMPPLEVSASSLILNACQC